MDKELAKELESTLFKGKAMISSCSTIYIRLSNVKAFFDICGIDGLYGGEGFNCVTSECVMLDTSNVINAIKGSIEDGTYKRAVKYGEELICSLQKVMW